MASTAVDALTRPEVIAAAKAEHHAKTGGVYVCPLPADAEPPIGMSLAV